METPHRNPTTSLGSADRIRLTKAQNPLSTARSSIVIAYYRNLDISLRVYVKLIHNLNLSEHCTSVSDSKRLPISLACLDYARF